MYSEDRQLQLNKAWKDLTQFGTPIMVFRCHYPWMQDNRDTLRYVGNLIASMANFNEKDSQKIGRGFPDFFKSLPVGYNTKSSHGQECYYIFNNITLQGDDTIILSGVCPLDNKEQMERQITQYIEVIGKRWKADECNLFIDDNCYNGSLFTIRFWWD